MHVLRLRQLGRRPSQDRRQPFGRRRAASPPPTATATSTGRSSERFTEIFEREVAVFFVGTGTAANSLSLAAFNQPGGISFCHREAHVIEDECGAPEYLIGRLAAACRRWRAGQASTPDNLERAIGRFAPEFVHCGRPMAVSITQATEVGTVYSLDEIEAISAIAKQHDLPLHMDGARFANALVALDTTPAEMTWKRGVDILSFGGTKNGCWCAEAVVLFDLDRAEELAFLRKRAAQLFSKSRFIAAQFDAYFEDDLWLETAAPCQRHGRAAGGRHRGVEPSARSPGSRRPTRSSRS